MCQASHGWLPILCQQSPISFKAEDFTLLSALGLTLKRKICKLDRGLEWNSNERISQGKDI